MADWAGLGEGMVGKQGMVSECSRGTRLKRMQGEWPLAGFSPVARGNEPVGSSCVLVLGLVSFLCRRGDGNVLNLPPPSILWPLLEWEWLVSMATGGLGVAPTSWR